MNPNAMNATPMNAPKLPIELCEAILATVPKLPTVMFATSQRSRKRHFNKLIRVLPRSIVPSSFCSAFLAQAKSNPWAVYAAFDRLAMRFWRLGNPELARIDTIIQHLKPALQLRTLVMPEFDFDALRPTFVESGVPPPRVLSLAGAFAVSQSVRGNLGPLKLLVSRPWIEPGMWAEAVLHDFIRLGCEDELKWWDEQQFAIPGDSMPEHIILQAIRHGFVWSLSWIMDKLEDEMPDMDYDELIRAGVTSGRPEMMELIYEYWGLDDEPVFEFDWAAVSECRSISGDAAWRILEWAQRREIPFPDPVLLMDCLDEAASTQVLDWWTQYYLYPDQVSHSTAALLLATQREDLEQLDWWYRSGLELRFSPQAIELAKGKPELEQWWNQRVEYKLLSGAITVEEAAAAGIAPCSHFETLCAWGRLDLMEAAGIDSQLAQDTIHFHFLYRAIRAACQFGHVSVLERFPQLVDAIRDATILKDCASLAIESNQKNVLEWFWNYGYLASFSENWWQKLALEALSANGNSACIMIEWMYNKRLLPSPLSKKLVRNALDSPGGFPVLYLLWKHGGFGIYSFVLMDRVIRAAIDAGCKEMTDWWMEKQGDILHDVHIELLSEAAE